MFLGLSNAKCDFGDAANQKEDSASLKEEQGQGDIQLSGALMLENDLFHKGSKIPCRVVWVSEGTSIPDSTLGLFHTEETARSCPWP